MRHTLYNKIANIIAEQIYNKTYLSGDKLPSIRVASQQFSTSPTTIQQAYRELENTGLIKAVPQSGYYVRQQLVATPPFQENELETPAPIDVSLSKTALSIFEECEQPGLINLGTAFPHSDFLPLAQLQRIFSRLARFNIRDIVTASFSVGHEGLRRQIAQRLTGIGCEILPQEVIVTNGCQDALSLCLSSVAQTGDTIAIETPTFPGLLQSIESLGMKALEIPTHPKKGISLEALELAVEQWPVKACALVPAFNNPLGSNMSAENKEKLVALLAKHKIPLIEDDLFGDLYFSGSRIPAAKSFDKEGMVLYCSSISKSIGSGLRVGWACPGRYFEKMKQLKAYRDVNGPPLEQMAVAEFMANGSYDRHIRNIRKTYMRQIQLFSSAVIDYFPEGTRISQPEGGYILWVELPNKKNSWDLYKKALKEHIAIIPGELCSATNRYQSFFRLNAAVPWDTVIEQAIIKLGKLAHAC